jgi:alkylation response protein AidB-like acyl-CoA dehydrogenase
MVATGSVTVAVDDVFVPDGWGMELGAVVSATGHYGMEHTEAIYRYSFGALGTSNLSIGIGALDRALEICREKLETSRPMGVARIDRSTSRIRWAKALQNARVARCIRDAYVEELIEQVEMGESATPESEALAGMNGITINQLVVEATRSLLDGFGTSSYHTNDQLRRLTGDVAMLSTHGLAADYDVHMDRHSRAVLGLA